LTPKPVYEGLATRAIAFALDAAVIDGVAFAVAGIVALVLSVLSVPNELEVVLLGVGGVLFFLWTIGYFATFWSTTGQTPGDRLMRIRVCSAETGKPIGFGRSVLRLVYMTVAAIPLLLGFAPILFDDRRRGVHDMLAGTVVIAAPDEPVAVSPAGPSRVRTPPG
jgi:uncharacterized RDD family membrane protein YckC